MLSRIKILVVCLLAFFAAIAVDAGLGVAEDNRYEIYGDTDAPGFDYEAYSPPSLDSCQNQCGEDNQCKAFTFNHAKQVCFLKLGARVPLKRHEEATTGVKIGKSRFSTKRNKDAPGYDYRQFVPPTFNSCRQLCDQEPKCTSFTYNEAKRVCFLKSKRDIALIRHPGAITGVKIVERSRSPPDAASDSPPAQSFIATGTGLTVSNDGLVLTNSHVVEQCSSITVYDRGLARIKQIDEINDLALLKIEGKTNAAKFRAASPRLGGSVYALGFPYSGVLSGSVNFTSGNISSLSGIKNDTRYLQFTALCNLATLVAPSSMMRDMSWESSLVVSPTLKC